MKGRKKFFKVAATVVAVVVALTFFQGSMRAAETAKLFSYITETNAGQATANVGKHDYSVWARTVKSDLSQNADGTYMRVEYSDGKVYVEDWSADFTLKSQKVIEAPLPVFGGIFVGEKYNFIVFGQDNPEDSSSVEVMRIVKYDKDWNELNYITAKNINTYAFADGGSLAMAECSGYLVIHTCHEMYKTSDGYHHQANMTFAIKEDTMNQIQTSYSVSNISTGYVSHSFNQYVLADDNYIYRLDHGDAYPRGLVLTKASISSIKSVKYKTLISIGGKEGNNYTGLSSGGCILAGDKIISAGNSVDQTASGWTPYGQRNIFVTVTDTNLSSSATKYLTNYGSDAGIDISTPYIVKGNDVSYVLWEETGTAGGSGSFSNETLIRIAKISNTDGSLIKMYDGIYGRLSDCEPLLTDDGSLVWYTTSDSAPVFYSLDTNKLSDYAIKDYFKDNTSSDKTDKGSSSTSKKNAVKVSKVKITGISTRIAAGKKISLKASVSPANAANKKVVWKSGNTKIAAVNQNGVVTLKKNTGGKSVVITAAAADGSGVKGTFTIRSMSGFVKKITVKGAKSVKAGKSLQLKATVKATKGANKKVLWISGNTKYATVSSSGKVKTTRAGKGKKVKITVMSTDGTNQKKTVTIRIK